jgi:hypothetical protein
MEAARVIKLRDDKTLTGDLQDDLLKVIRSAKYDDLTIAQIVGVLEFLKWNLINGA